MEVDLIFPVNGKGNCDMKTLQLGKVDLLALSMSTKLGSQGHYYYIKDKIFEDSPKNGIRMTIILEDEDEL